MKAHFPGSPVHVDASREALGLPEGGEAHRAALRNPAVAQVSHLVEQALCHAEPPADTVRRVRELVAGLKLAAASAESLALLIDPPAEAEGGDGP